VWPLTTVQTCIIHYPDTAVMPMPGREGPGGLGDRAGDTGIITGAQSGPHLKYVVQPPIASG
jgi:hypothetical protein